MELFDENLEDARTIWQSPARRQNFQMIIYKAIAASTDLPAKEVEEVIAEIGRILEIEEKDAPRPDPAI